MLQLIHACFISAASKKIFIKNVWENQSQTAKLLERFLEKNKCDIDCLVHKLSPLHSKTVTFCIYCKKEKVIEVSDPNQFLHYINVSDYI
jgi:hypothetical protein